MARFIYQGTFQDGTGRAIAGGTVTVYLAGTTTAATIYPAETGDADADNTVESASNGSFSFWIDDTGGYTTAQRFKVVLSKNGYTTQTWDDIAIINTYVLGSDADAVTGTSETVAVTPHGLTARLAEPGTIGGTTPGDGNFAAVTLTTDLAVTHGGTGVSTLADGGLVVGNGTSAVEVLDAGATTEMLVGGGASTKPVWTTATGSGAPVRATSPTLVTPALGTPASGDLQNCTGYPVPVGGTPAVTLGTANAAGSAATFVKTDATILFFDATDPSTQAFSDAAVVGTAAVAARRDHKHAMPASPAASPGGADTQIQYNDGGAFAGSAYLTFSKTTGGITKAGKGTGNIFAGAGAGNATMSGDQNIMIGDGTGDAITTAANSIAIGENAMGAGAVAGDDNIAIGQLAGNDLTSGSYNILIGESAGANLTTVLNCIAIGQNALDVATTDTVRAIAIGQNSMGAGVITGTDNIGIGSQTGNDLTDGAYNILVGALAGANITEAGYSIAIGVQAMGSGVSTGDDNVAIGREAGLALTSGDDNIFIGAQAGNSVTTGDNNICIGYNQDTPAANTNNHLNIGGAIKGDVSTGTINILAAYSTDLNGTTFRDLQIKNDGLLGYDSSSIVGKGDIRSIVDTSWIHSLRPVIYKPKKREEYVIQEERLVDRFIPEVYGEVLVAATEDEPERREEILITPAHTEKVTKIIDIKKERYIEELYDFDQYGLIAEEVAEINPLVVFHDSEGNPAGVHYNKMLMIPMLVEIQKLRKEIDILKGVEIIK